MSKRDLPAEVLLQIFSFLSKQDCYRCMFVCKSWYSLALQGFYRVISFDDDNGEVIRARMTANKNFGQHCNGHWVKKLCFFYYKSINLEQDEFLSLLPQFPNVEEIWYHGSYSKLEGFADMLDFVVDNNNVCFRKVKNIQYDTVKLARHDNSMARATKRRNFLTCYKLRTSISHLLIDFIEQQYLINGEAASCIYFLPHFKNLTDLTIRNETGDENLVMFTALHACPNLIFFCFQSYRNPPDTVADNMLASIDQHHQQKYLKSITLKVPTIPKSYVQYIVSHISNLQLQEVSLDINNSRINFIDWIQGNDNAITALSLADHLSSVRTFSLIDSGHYGTIPNTAKVTYLWQFINAIKGSRKLFCRVKFNSLKIHTNQLYAPHAPTVDIQVRDNCSISIIYSQHGSMDLSFLQTPPSASFFSNDLKKISGPELINSLNVFIEDRGNEQYLTQLLDLFVMNNCPQLNHLVIRFLSFNHEFIKYTTKHHDTNQIKLSGWLLTSNLLNLITTGFSMMYNSNIKALKFKCCKFYYDLNGNSTLDLKTFEELDCLELTNINLGNNSRPTIWIVFDYNEGESLSCYKVWIRVSSGGRNQKVAAARREISLEPTQEFEQVRDHLYASNTVSVVTVQLRGKLTKKFKFLEHDYFSKNKPELSFTTTTTNNQE